MSDLSFYGPAGLLLLAFLCKVPGLIREPRELLQRSVAMLLAVSSAMAFFAAIPSIAWLNAVTGIPNIAAPVVYSLMTAYSGSCVILLIRWRGGPAARTRRASRWCLAVHLAVITAIFGLFAAGDAPVERLHDFDTYYATTPYLRAMICLYVSAHTVAALLMTFLCWRWSRSVHGLLRAGLILLVIACLLNLSYDVCKIIAVVARWSGHDLDHLSTWAAPPLTAMASLFQSSGFILPLAGQWIGRVRRTWARYRALEPLWAALRGTLPRGPVRIAWWSSPELRLMQRESEIHDGVLALDPYFEPALRRAVSTRARSIGTPPEQAAAIGTAAMITAALRARADDPEGDILSSARAYQPDTSTAFGDLTSVSRALRPLRGHPYHPHDPP
ncbi:MAB_1171c family putative transporter [Streptomyces sp. PA5.6]|uniref:MAB_1171c family putative transporter n=1 Tax=Streptomyces sp. PA5.6 TaxID=3035651 RepID=UPI003904AC8B